jgi:hypothetical protein
MRLQSLPSLHWCADSGQVLVVDEARDRSFVLKGFEASLWNWLALALSFSKIVEFAACWTPADDGNAEERVRGVLEHWLNLGIIEPGGCNEHG